MASDAFDMLRCPVCRHDLSHDADYLICAGCWIKFPIVEGIAILMTENDRSDVGRQALGHECFRSSADALPGLMVVSDELPPPLIRSIYEEAASEGRRTELFRTGVFARSHNVPDELDRALQSSTEKAIEMSQARSARCVLNWPTGWGHGLYRLTSQVRDDAVIVAMDANFKTLATIKPYFDSRGTSENILFVTANALNMPFRDGVFQAAVLLDGSLQMERADACLAETYRVMASGGRVGINGDVYREWSPSMAIAEYWSMDSLATAARLEGEMRRIGFTNITHEVLFQGSDVIQHNLDEEERSLLPAPGDWFQHIAAGGQK